MRTLRMMVLALAGVLMVACGADVGEHGTRLVVDEAQMTSEVLYMLPEVSQVPFTALELQEQNIEPSSAIPVRVEIYEGTAVAWFAPDGEARIGADWIIALWSVDRVPVSNETAADGTGSIRTPGQTVDATDLNVPSRPDYDIQLNDTTHPGEVAIIDFADLLGTPVEFQHFEEIVNYHPGCLEE